LAVFDGMIREGAPAVRGGRSRARSYVERSAADRAREAETHYLAGLGYMGKGDRAAAITEFKAALASQPAHIAAAAALR
jgi:Tfp pilus assembly protein PilF